MLSSSDSGVHQRSPRPRRRRAHGCAHATSAPRDRAARRWTALLPALLAGLAPLSPLGAQELGNKLLGGIGVDAGTQPAPGLYLLDRVVVYGADQVRDRRGQPIPIRGLEAEVLATVLGLSFTARVAGPVHYTFAAGAPLADVSVNADNPNLALDAAGFGDLFVQPVKLGGRFEQFDVVASYTFYAPTGRFEPRRLSVGRGFWTHQLSVGGAIYADALRMGRLSVLASRDFNGRKRGIDIERGNTFQLQGGVGVPLAPGFYVGVAGFAFWQITDNTGSDLPPAVRGARSRAFGLGPEVGATIPSIRTRIDLRVEWEFGVRSRQEGWIVVTSASFVAWQPGRPGPAR